MMDLLAGVLGVMGLWLFLYLVFAGLIFGAAKGWKWAARRLRRFRHEVRLRWVGYCQSVVDGAYVSENIGWLAQVGEWELEADAGDHRLPLDKRRGK